MNMFNFLDNLIKGIVHFLLDLLYSVATLIVHPLSGAPRLYREDQDRTSPQMSSITFLSLALLVAGAIYAGDVGPGNPEAADAKLGAITGFMTGGSQPEGFAPIIAGAVIAVVLISIAFRAVAGLRRLEGRRRQRFVAVMEYQVGLFLLLIALIVLWEMSLPDDPNAPVGSMDWFLLAYPLLVIAFVALGAQFWMGLMRTPRLHRLRRRLPRLRRRWTRRHYAPGAKAAEAGDAGKPGSMSALLTCVPLVLIALPLAAIPPALVGWLGQSGGWSVSHWMLEQEQARQAAKTVTTLSLTGLRCDLRQPDPSASAIVSNNTREPVRDWLAGLAIDVVDNQDTTIRAPLEWTPARTDGKSSDVLLPGQSVELAGSLVVSEEALRLARTGHEPWCGLAPDNAAVSQSDNDSGAILGAEAEAGAEAGAEAEAEAGAADPAAAEDGAP